MENYTFDKRPVRAKKPRTEENPDPVRFAVERLGFCPDAKQSEVLRSTAKRGILNCTRQWGKSTTAAAKAVYQAYTHAECLVLVASPSERQSGEFVRKAGTFLMKLGIAPRGDGDNGTSLMLPNGSRIVGLPGNEGTVRGFSAVSLLLIDEAARVDDEMYQALRPMLAVGDGDLWMMSTPNGRRGFFYDAWMDRATEWMRVSVPATACPRIGAEFLDEQRRTMTAAWFGQEYLCEFTDDGTRTFEQTLVDAAFDDGVWAIEV